MVSGPHPYCRIPHDWQVSKGASPSLPPQSSPWAAGVTDLVGRGRRGGWGGAGMVQGDRAPAAASVSAERVRRSERPQHPPLRPGRPLPAGNLSCSLRRKEREPRRSQRPPPHTPPFDPHPPPPHPLDLNVQRLPGQQHETYTHIHTRCHTDTQIDTSTISRPPTAKGWGFQG